MYICGKCILTICMTTIIPISMQKTVRAQIRPVKKNSQVVRIAKNICSISYVPHISGWNAINLENVIQMHVFLELLFSLDCHFGGFKLKNEAWWDVCFLMLVFRNFLILADKIRRSARFWLPIQNLNSVCFHVIISYFLSYCIKFETLYTLKKRCHLNQHSSHGNTKDTSPAL